MTVRGVTPEKVRELRSASLSGAASWVQSESSEVTAPAVLTRAPGDGRRARQSVAGVGNASLQLPTPGAPGGVRGARAAFVHRQPVDVWTTWRFNQIHALRFAVGREAGAEAWASAEHRIKRLLWTTPLEARPVLIAMLDRTMVQGQPLSTHLYQTMSAPHDVHFLEFTSTYRRSGPTRGEPRVLEGDPFGAPPEWDPWCAHRGAPPSSPWDAPWPSEYQRHPAFENASV